MEQAASFLQQVAVNFFAAGRRKHIMYRQCEVSSQRVWIRLAEAAQGTHWPQAWSKDATTRSPTLMFLTSGPTLSTMPMNCGHQDGV